MPPPPTSLLVIGLGPTGIEVALAIAESGSCCLSLGDDALASTEWRKSALCLLQRSPTVSAESAADFGAGKAIKRSQCLSAILTPLGTQSIAPISPVGDASIVERFDVVIMTDPTLPQAIAFNEHARAVGCGFILTEARGAVGRMFEDLPIRGGDQDVFSRSFREALIDPRISTQSHQRHGDRNHGDEQPITPTPPMVHNAHHETGASRPPRPRHNSANARESVLSGLVSSSKYVLQQGTRDGGGAVARAMPGRYAQLHVCLQALHVFWQEHGHLPLVLDRDQADEIVRIADELVEAGNHVPKGFSSQPESVDGALCHRVAIISRVSVHAVCFQLAGLAAATALHYLRAHHSVHPSQGGRATANKEERFSRKGTVQQWVFVDELDSGLSGSSPGGDAAPISEQLENRISVDPHPLEAWLGPDECKNVAGARVAVIGCGRLGRDFIRCLLLTGACTEPRGRMVFIDHGDAALKNPDSSRQKADGSIIPGRASVIRDLVAGHTGPGGFRISAYEGGAQDTDTEMDLWEGVDAVILCAGRGGAARRSGGAAQGGCEALVRFVSHKCVLHGKPLVWGWAGAAGEGGAGVEVMAPERTSCLVCSSHGGVNELIERRSIANADGFATPSPPHVSFSATKHGHRDGILDEAWDPNGRSFGVSRCAVAGVMIAELVKVLKPGCRREQLRNWRLEIGSSSHCYKEGGSLRSDVSGSTEGRGEGATSPNFQTNWKDKGTIRQVATTPDPPRMVLSTSFDPFSGDSLRAIPEGFTEWGVEEIRPSLFNRTYVPRRGKADIKDPFSLRALLTIVFARFGVDAKAVSTAAPGSECLVGAGGCRERGGACGEHLLWAEWEKVAGTYARQDAEKGVSVASKVDQSVLCLWQKAMSPASQDVEEGRHASRGRKEPRFLYLDIRGVMGGENAVLPVLKYWVR